MERKLVKIGRTHHSRNGEGLVTYDTCHFGEQIGIVWCWHKYNGEAKKVINGDCQSSMFNAVGDVSCIFFVTNIVVKHVIFVDI